MTATRTLSTVMVMMAMILTLLLAPQSTLVHAWWCTGHMTIAQIAAQVASPIAVRRVQKIVKQLSEAGPFPANPDLMQVSCWADDLKKNQDAMASWHFINLPYNPTHFPVTTVPLQGENVETTIPQMQRSIDWWNKPNNWEMQFATANLIHFIGDIHQPLHCTDMYSKQFPHGDLGGNLFMVYVNTTKVKLHDVWDSVCWQYVIDLPRPLNSTNVAFIKKLANKYMNAYNFTHKEKHEYNSTIFAAESYQYAIAYAYSTLVPGDKLSSKYLKTCDHYAGKRIAIAGYRLGNTLEYLFGDDAKEEPTPKKIYGIIRKISKEIEGFSKQKGGVLKKHL